MPSFEIKFTENDQDLNADFNEVIIVERGGYEQGYQDGKQDGYTSGYDEGYSKGDSDGYDKGFTDGENSVVNYMNLCSYIRFNNLNLFGKSEVVLDLPRVYDLSYLCSPESKKENTNTTVEHITINCPNEVTTLRGVFACNGNTLDRKLKRITLNVGTNKVENCTGAFQGLKVLEVIDGTPFNLSSIKNAQNQLFSGNDLLKEVRFVPNTILNNFYVNGSPLISNETIQSIIDGLADLTGQTAQTLTLHADVGAKLTDEQKAVITAKNWILAY